MLNDWLLNTYCVGCDINYCIVVLHLMWSKVHILNTITQSSGYYCPTLLLWASKWSDTLLVSWEETYQTGKYLLQLSKGSNQPEVVLEKKPASLHRLCASSCSLEEPFLRWKWIWVQKGVFAAVCLSVCLCVCLFFHTISQKPTQLGSPNSTQKYSTTSPDNSFILGSEGQRSRSQVTKTLLAWVVALSWVLAASSIAIIFTNLCHLALLSHFGGFDKCQDLGYLLK